MVAHGPELRLEAMPLACSVLDLGSPLPLQGSERVPHGLELLR
jgi:hypothetical protein